MFGDKLLLLKKRAGLLAEINAFSGGFEASRVFVTYLSGNRLIDQKLYPPVTRLTSHTQGVV